MNMKLRPKKKPPELDSEIRLGVGGEESTSVKQSETIHLQTS